MRVFVLLVLTLVGALARKRETVTTQEDFEFVEDSAESGDRVAKIKDDAVWILDPTNELCSLLRCGDDGICLLQDKFTAVCVSKEEADKLGKRIVTNSRGFNDKVDVFDDSEDSYEDGDEEYDEEDDYYEDEDDQFNQDDFEDDKSGLPKLNRRPFARKQCSSCPVVRPVFLCGNDNRTYSSLCRLHYHNCLHEANVKIDCKGFCPCRDPKSKLARKEKKRKRMNKYMNKLRETLNDDDSEPEIASRKKQTPYKTRGKKTSRGSAGGNRNKNYNYFKNGAKGKSNHAKINSKYDKYWAKKRSGSSSSKDDSEARATNSVWGNNECSQEELETMGNRMLDWFSVIMTESRRRPTNPLPAPVWCKKEVSWMLGHLDLDTDSRLSEKELYRLEHDDRERCIKPFIDRCDLDRDKFLSGREWCKCFDQSERPCAALRKATKDLLGGYIPECDSEGYYLAMQCHLSASMCWCVDKHGVEIKASRVRGKPNCDAFVRNGRMIPSNHIDDDAEGGADDSDNFEGSADDSFEI